MMQLSVDSDGDRVVLAFSQRGQSVGLHFEQATAVSNAIRVKAREAEGWVKSGGKQSLVNPGDARKVGVQARDGQVWLVFSEGTDRELLPYEAAFKLAEEIDDAVLKVMYRVAFQHSKKWSEL